MMGIAFKCFVEKFSLITFHHAFIHDCFMRLLLGRESLGLELGVSCLGFAAWSQNHEFLLITGCPFLELKARYF